MTVRRSEMSSGTGVSDYVCMHTWIRNCIPTESQMIPNCIPTESQMSTNWIPNESQLNPKKLAESWILNPKTSNKSLLNPESWIPKPQTKCTESLNPESQLNPDWIPTESWIPTTESWIPTQKNPALQNQPNSRWERALIDNQHWKVHFSWNFKTQFLVFLCECHSWVLDVFWYFVSRVI